MLHFQSYQAITNTLADYFYILLKPTGIIGLVFTLIMYKSEKDWTFTD